jgi:hypothetical protein
MHTAVWTGEEMIIWGGCGSANSCTQFLGDGARYNTSTDSWTPITTTLALSPRYRHTAVWTGSNMLVWGGQSNLGGLTNGAHYNPGNDSWTPMSGSNAPSSRITHTAVWAIEAMIIWGGDTNTGAIYYPSLDIWSPMSTEGTPSPRSFHTAVWGNDRMIVWGGCNAFSTGACDQFLDTGGVYVPAMVTLHRNYLPTVLGDRGSTECQ